MSAITHYLPDLAFSVKVTAQTDTVVSTFPWKEREERGKYKSLILSHKTYTRTHDLNAHRQTGRVFRLRTHTNTLRQFVTLNVLRSTDKKGKKSPGYRFNFWLFGERKEKRGREGRRDGEEVKGRLLVSFLSFPWGSDWATSAHAPTTTIEQFLVRRFENLEGAHEGLIYAHHGACIVKLAAVVWG